MNPFFSPSLALHTERKLKRDQRVWDEVLECQNLIRWEILQIFVQMVGMMAILTLRSYSKQEATVLTFSNNETVQAVIMTKASKGRERWTMGNGWGSNYAGPSTICPKHCSRSHDLFYSLFKHLQKETIFFPNNNYQISFLFLVFEFVLDFSKHKKAAFGCYS